MQRVFRGDAACLHALNGHLNASKGDQRPSLGLYMPAYATMMYYDVGMDGQGSPMAESTTSLAREAQSSCPLFDWAYRCDRSTDKAELLSLAAK